MKTRFNQKMVTIDISDHHMDEKEMRDERLFQATLAFAKAVKESVDDGTFKKAGMPDVACVCLFSEDSRFSGKFIQVLIYGVPKEKRQSLLFLWNVWELRSILPTHWPWFREDEIGLNVEFCDGDVCNIYSRNIITWNK
jgi:hypothetical protein